MRHLLFWACTVFSINAFAAEQPLSPWQRENVLVAASQIGLTREQIPQFKENLFDFVDSRTKMVNKIYRREDMNLDRIVKSKTNRLLKKMDKAMAAMMDEKQYVAYENYRNLLKAEMDVQKKGAETPGFDGQTIFAN
jgi:hypothetical protein